MKPVRTRVDIPVGETVPDIGLVLAGQGMPDGVRHDNRHRAMAEQALGRYAELARPQGVVMDVGQGEFGDIYQGEGMNEQRSPIGSIYGQTSHLALFAVTVGPAPGREIERLFRENDFAIGAMLDSAASAGAELAAGIMERQWRQQLKRSGQLAPGTATMRFSPGYCGWHVSGQKKLFGALRPSDIGIELNDSFLMQPLKSVSGVIAAGDGRIFVTGQGWPACGVCRTPSCRERQEGLSRHQ